MSNSERDPVRAALADKLDDDLKLWDRRSYRTPIDNYGFRIGEAEVRMVIEALRALPPTLNSGAEPVAWLDIRTANLGWQNRLVATNPQYVENNGPENFVALYAVPRSERLSPKPPADMRQIFSDGDNTHRGRR